MKLLSSGVNENETLMMIVSRLSMAAIPVGSDRISSWRNGTRFGFQRLIQHPQDGGYTDDI